MKKNLVYFAAILLLAANFSYSQRNGSNTSLYEETSDSTLSPYFLIISDDKSIEDVPLLSTSAEVSIQGVIADVTVRQVYKNNGKKPIEAIYVFPGSTRAAVYAMTMKIGERVLVAQIQKKEEARQTYEKAKKEGKSASLLEQNKPNVFTMNVANILPGDLITVEMKYTELLIPESGYYDFVYPTVVGPRYSNKSSEKAGNDGQFVNSPYQHEGEKPTYKFDIKLRLNAGMPIEDIKCNTHKIDVKYENADKFNADITLAQSESSGGNRDFILSYSLSGGKIQSGLLMNEGKENFFLLMLQPPLKVKPDAMPPREYFFVVDVSGSMWGFPLDISKKLIKNLLGSLREQDFFNILLFAGGSEVMSCSPMPATKDNIGAAIKLIDSKHGGGGTELLPALKMAYRISKIPGVSRSIVLLTDGFVDVEEEVFDLIGKNLNEANFFAFGIGSSVNRYIIEGAARCGMGQPFFAINQKKAEEEAEKFRSYIQSPVLTNVKVSFDGFTASEIEPPSIPDVFEQRPVTIFGKWSGEPTGNIVVTGNFGNTQLKTTINVLQFMTHDTSQALKYLWARNKIARLNDYNNLRESKDRACEVTDLGLKYNLLTKYTSFVAVDYLTRNADSSVKVKQPLPMPEGVSDYAIGSGGIKSFSSVQSLSAPSTFSSGSSPSRNNQIIYCVIGKKEVSKETITMVDGLESLPNEDEFLAVESEPQVDLAVLGRNVIYPEAARLSSVEGRVIVRALIEKTGICKTARITYSDSQMLNQSAIDAVMKTKFTPAIQNGQPVSCWVTIPINFKLKDIDTSKNSKDSTVKLAFSKFSDKPPVKTEKGTYKISDGTEFTDDVVGQGDVVKEGKRLIINYITYFDDCSEQTNTYKIGKPVAYIYGESTTLPDALVESLIGMRVGGKRTVYPADANYDFSTPNKFKMIKVELLEVK